MTVASAGPAYTLVAVVLVVVTRLGPPHRACSYIRCTACNRVQPHILHFPVPPSCLYDAWSQLLHLDMRSVLPPA